MAHRRLINPYESSAASGTWWTIVPPIARRFCHLSFLLHEFSTIVPDFLPLGAFCSAPACTFSAIPIYSGRSSRAWYPSSEFLCPEHSALAGAPSFSILESRPKFPQFLNLFQPFLGHTSFSGRSTEQCLEVAKGQSFRFSVWSNFYVRRRAQMTRISDFGRQNDVRRLRSYHRPFVFVLSFGAQAPLVGFFIWGGLLLSIRTG